jgi:hypothetical protein
LSHTRAINHHTRLTHPMQSGEMLSFSATLGSLRSLRYALKLSISSAPPNPDTIHPNYRRISLIIWTIDRLFHSRFVYLSLPGCSFTIRANSPP